MPDTKGALLKAKDKGPKILAVTSGKGGVGKTNVVANLSVCLSELGKKVVVLDADFGLANLDVLLGLGAEFDRRKAEIGESAQVDEVHLGVPADFLICGDELGPAFGGELPAGLRVVVRADSDFTANVPVGRNVFVRYRTGADEADPQAAFSLNSKLAV